MTFYFFDLETSGFRADSDRIMQFAGQRTDMNLKSIGEPDNILVKLSDDVLPQPEAVLVHGISPQIVNREGITEVELAKYLTSQVFVPDTIAVGYNNIRFDNNFIRFLMWRNFYDAYEWSWKNNCSTWDLLDVVRMTRALRPEGIKWPFGSDGKPSNKLELLSSVNKLQHAKAHDALSDVQAAIALARLLKTKQPKIFDYLLKHRTKDSVAPLVNSGKPFLYTSGRYSSQWLKTTIAVGVTRHKEQNAAIVYDLRIDPDEWAAKSPEQLAAAWSYRPPRDMQLSRVQGGSEQRTELYENSTAKEQAQLTTQQSADSSSRVGGSAVKQAGALHDAGYFPVKKLRFNRCPAVVADLRVLDKASEKRLELHPPIINRHLEKLQKYEDFGDKLLRALEIMDKPEQANLIVTEQDVDSALYQGFVNDSDKSKMRVVRAAEANELADLKLDFADERLNLLLPIYKARNFPELLTQEEQDWWRGFKTTRLTSGGKQSLASDYFAKINELSASAGLAKPAKHLLTDLQSWGERVVQAAEASAPHN